MKNHNSIALISLPTLYNIALHQILDNICDRECIEFSSTGQMVEADNIPDRIITSPSEFLAHLDFYIPRKDSVLILYSDDFSLKNRSLNTLCINDNEAFLYERISEFIEEKGYDNIKKVELSNREKDVLKEIVAGKTNKEIADSLNISVNTVITHRKNLSMKLGIKSASGLSLYAMMNGLI